MDDANGAARRVADYAEWQARDYFDTYYSEVVLPDEQVVLAYQIEVMQRRLSGFARGLEYGCGPTLHRAIAMARYTTRVDMADWLADNLLCVRQWLDADERDSDWNRFTHFILGCEGLRDADAARVACREKQARAAIHQLTVSDARWPDPLGAAHRGAYDLLVSGFCLDAISSDRRVWRRCMSNVLSTLAPGGTVILHFLHRCRAYKVGERMFPGSNLCTDDLVRCLREEGFTQSSLDVQLIPCPDNAQYGYTGILTASARRSLR